MYFRSSLRQDFQTSQGSYQNINMTKSLQLGDNVLFAFNKLVKILPQNEKNRERLLQKFSTAEKEIVRVLYVGNHPKSGKTVNIHGKICR